MRRVRRFDPQITEQAAWVAGTLFAVILLLTTVFLWNAHRLPGWLGAALAALIVALLWLVGFVTNPADDEPDIAPDTVPEAGRAQQVP
jgi:peptidoglycan/LPS O-acetylase OafA/YrhL